MTESRRRLTGVFALLLLAGLLGALSVWRLQTAARIGWAGMTYLPLTPKKSTAATMPMGFNPGSVIMVYPAAPADRAGIQRGDEVVAINGIPANDRPRLTKLAQQVRVDDLVTYTVKRAGVITTIPLRFDSPTRATPIMVVLTMNILVALTFLSIGLFVFWRRPSDARAIVFYVMTLTAAASFVGSALSQIDTANMRGIAAEPTVIDLGRSMIVVVTAVFFAPLLLHLSLIFPVERPILARRRRVLFQWIYGAPVYICVCIAAIVAVYGMLISARIQNQKGVGKTVVLSLVSILAIMTVLAIVRIFVRIRKTSFREGVITSPIAIMTLILTVSCTVFGSAAVLSGKTHSPGVMIAMTGIMVVFCFAFLSAYPISTVVSLYRSYRESGVEERRQVKWPLWGTIVAVAGRLILMAIGIGIGLAFAFGKSMGISPIVMAAPEVIAKALYTLIPLSFAFAILKYRLMNIDVIIRRTVMYTMLTGVIFVLYAVLVAGLGTALIKFAGVKNQNILIASTVVIALVTVPLRNKLQHLVDRNLFRERRDYALALRSISNAIGTSTAVEAFLRYSAEQIQQSLQNRFTLIALRRDGEFVAAAKIGIADEIVGSLRVPVDTVSFEGRTIPDALRRLGTELVVPIAAHRQPTGLVALGSRLSDEEFSAADTEFILAAAAQIAVGIENVRLRDEEADFEQARSMQQILLPKSIPQLPGLAISGLWQPARSVGGDYFDVLPLGDGRAGLCIADVAGKGMPAALLMANLQAAVKASASRDAAPAAVCERVKSIVIGNLAGGKFISFFYAVLDAPSRSLTYCNAGHNPPIIARASSRIDRLMRGGPAICRLFQSAVHEQETVSLEPGDRVILFTDGVSEARRGEEEFGEDRLIELIISHRNLGARELEEKILTRLREFTAGDFSDDVTMVIVAAV